MGVDSQCTMLSSGEDMRVAVTVASREHMPSVSLGMMIRDRFGQDIFGTNTHLLDHAIALEPDRAHRLVFRFPMLLAPGKYTITLALHEGIDHTRHCYHWWDDAVRFEVSGIRGPQFGGLCNLQPVIERL